MAIQTYKSPWLQVCLALSLGIVLSNSARAAEVTLAWDPNSESDLAGYKLYYENETDPGLYNGTGAIEGDSPVTICLEDLADSGEPLFTITDLEGGLYYYFVLTAFNTSGLESDFSNEVNTLTALVDDLEYPDEPNSGSTDNSESPDEPNSGSVAASSGSSGGGCFISSVLAINF